MPLPTRAEAQALLEHHVKDEYQRYHARMVATAMEGYAGHFGEDPELWFLTGYLHDLDFEEHPEEHPGPSLSWFREWGYRKILSMPLRRTLMVTTASKPCRKPA